MTKPRSNKGEVNTDGYNYQLYTLLYCVDRLRNNEQVREYTIGKALEGFGALDDVVFTATLNSEERLTTAIQVKHSNTDKMIDEFYLCRNARTNLYKYFDSFVEIKKTTALEQLNQLILWTNMPIAENIREWFEFVPDTDKTDVLREEGVEGLSYERYRIQRDKRQEIVQKYLEYMRKDAKKVVQEPSGEDLGQFYDRFVFYVNVPNVKDLKSYLVRNTKICFDDLCKLVKNCVGKQVILSDQNIEKLYKLVYLRSSMETGPYTKLKFNDLDELKYKVENLFENNSASSILRVKASQDVDCTVARLIEVVEHCLAAESERYLVFSYKVFSEKWNEIRLLMEDDTLIEIGLKCIIISSISDEEIEKVKKQMSTMKVIFVGSEFRTYFDDEFDVKCLDDNIKDEISKKEIKLSTTQTATVKKIFGEKLFRTKNYLLVLKLYTLCPDDTSTLQSIAVEPSLDSNYLYLPRTVKLSTVENTTIDLSKQTDFSKIIIYDPPGMGKTTEMIKLCSEFRKSHKDHFVVYLHCTAAVAKWKGSAVNLICNFVSSCDKIKNVVQKIIQLGKLILIMDGYDEVSQKYNDKLKSMMSEISRIKMFRLYIATRLQSKDELKAILGECGLCQLTPLSEENQVQYLENVWNIEKASDESVKTKVKANIRCIISQFNSLENGKFLIGVPLQMHMIAVIYKDRILSADFTVSESHTFGTIYKEFFEFKFKEYIQNYFNNITAAHMYVSKSVIKMLWHDHIVFALKVLENGTQLETESKKLSGEEVLNNETQPEVKLLGEELQYYGLVDTRPAITFVHDTYFEFFMAKYLLTYSIEIAEMKNYLLKYINRNKSPLSLVYRFMDGLLKDERIKNENPNRSLLKSIYNERPFVNPPSANSRLHPDKMIEFEAALREVSYADITSIFSTLTASRLFRMFEVIYDSLSLEAKSRVRLCFLDHDEDNHKCTQQICLDFKRLTAILSGCSRSVQYIDTLISVLEILLNKNSDLLFKFFSTSIQEENFPLLKLMLEPKSKLLKWFTEKVPQVNVKTCLLEIIRCNNVDLLKEVVAWMKKKWEVEEIVRFLTNNNFLRLFIDHIQLVDDEQTLASVEPIRIEMAKNVYTLYNLAFDRDKVFFNETLNETKSLLEQKCEPDSKLFEWLIKIIPEGSVSACLLEIIRSYNVKFLEKAVTWIKHNWTEKQKNQFVMKNNLLPLFIKQIGMVQSIYDLYDNTLHQHIPSDRDFPIALRNQRMYLLELMFEPGSTETFVPQEHLSTCIEDIIRTNNVELLKKIVIWFKGNWLKEETYGFLMDHKILQLFIKRMNLVDGTQIEESVEFIKIQMVKSFYDLYNYAVDHDASSDFAIQSDRISLLKLMLEPGSKLFQWFLKIIPQEHLSTCVEEIIRTNNVELLKQIIAWFEGNCMQEEAYRFLTDNQILQLFIKRINLFDGESVELPTIEMVQSVYGLYIWAFDHDTPSDIAIQNERISLLKQMLERGSEQFGRFTEIVPQFHMSTCLKVIIRSSDVELLKTIIGIMKDKWTAEHTFRFLKDNNLLRWFIENTVSLVEPAKEEIVQIVYDLYDWAYVHVQGISENVMQNEKMSLLEQIFEGGSQYFEWVTKTVSQLNMSTCLQEMIISNKVVLLKQIVTWIKEKWAVEQTARFMTENRLLGFFIDHIELVEYAQTIDPVELKRIEMVQNVCDLFNWAYNHNVQLDQDILNKIRNIRSSSIRNEFENAFKLNDHHAPSRRSLCDCDIC